MAETEVDDADVTDSDDDVADEVPTRLARVESALADIGEFIRSGVGSVLTGDDDVEPDADVVDDEVTETATPKSARQTEIDVEQLVRKELSKVKREEETDARLKKVEEKVAEKPPAKQSPISRLLWGSVDAK